MNYLTEESLKTILPEYKQVFQTINEIRKSAKDDWTVEEYEQCSLIMRKNKKIIFINHLKTNLNFYDLHYLHYLLLWCAFNIFDTLIRNL